jgi:hypothetical protein
MIPKSIKVGNLTYTIEKVNHPLVLDNRENSGQIDYRNTVIRIREDGFSEQHQEETFWHEVVHAIIEREGLKFDDEELVCQSFGKAIHALLQDNPGVLSGESQITAGDHFDGWSTRALVDEIVRRGHGDKHFIEPHDEFTLRSYKQSNTVVHAAGTGPVLFLAVTD